MALPVMAQHAIPHTAGGVGRTSAPPMVVPTSQAPINRAPIRYAPISSTRIPVVPSAGNTLGAVRFRFPRRPTRPFPVVLVVYESPFLFGGPFWGLNACWSASCDLLWSGTLDYSTISSPGPTNYVAQSSETPAYAYGEERSDLPQLFLQDGTILNVTDYWLVDGQLHFTMIEDEGRKPAEHVIPFDALDLQTTVDENTRRGFRFMLRNEPWEQYLRDHPEGPPPTLAPHQN